jgi:2-oxoglutarate ferredoxin oxidoreductase subunit alpha
VPWAFNGCSRCQGWLGGEDFSGEDVDNWSSFLLKIKISDKIFFFWSFMMTKDKKRVLLTGNDAVVEGLCCAAGNNRRVVYAGYPITPASEIATRASVMLPKHGGTFIQMEDEIGSIQAISGAGLAGAIAVTATSGPGFSLMSEGLGFAAMIESPVICVNVQRGGPSTGMPTWMGQGDMMQARWGTHGDRPVIVLVPNSVEETLLLTYEACRLAQAYFTPVILMLDEIIGHMEEPISIPDLPPIPLDPDFEIIGEGHRRHRTGLTHDLEKNYPRINPDAEEKLVRHLLDKVKKDAQKIVKYETYGNLTDAGVIVICYGSESRSVKAAVKQARGKRLKVAMVRLITAWPFPKGLLQKLDGKKRMYMVAEINAGQIRVEVERYVKKGIVQGLNLMGGRIHTPGEVLEAIQEAKRH